MVMTSRKQTPVDPSRPLRALILSCTLKRKPARSNTEALAGVLIKEFARAGVITEMIRLVDLNILPGVETKQGRGDAWSRVHAKVLQSDIFVVATPTWFGQASSVCQRMLERMDGMIEEKTRDGRPTAFGKVAGLVITGNEDGAHHIVGSTSQALIDIGFTIPAQAWTYWHLGPGPGPDYLTTRRGHAYSDRTGRNAARNLVAAAVALRLHAFPVPER